MKRKKKKKEKFDQKRKVELKREKKAIEEGVIFRPGHGFIDGRFGDLIIISPPILTNTDEMGVIVDSIRKNIEKFC